MRCIILKTLCEGDFLIKTPKINIPFCSQEEFEKAALTVEMCVKPPVHGFIHDFIAPGGAYGNCWWSLDGALGADGFKWIDTDCDRKFLLNLCETQLPNGRIKLYGIDNFGHIPSVKAEIGSLPKFFTTCYNAAIRHNDKAITEKAFCLLDKNLDWWFKNRQDSKTKLISAVFEETFLPNLDFPVMEYCPPDTNVQIVLGCIYTSKLAVILGDIEKSEYYLEKATEIIHAINTYLWNEEKKAYYPYILSKKCHYDTLLASTFNALSFNKDNERKIELLKKLTDNSFFGWDEHTVTTVARNDKAFTIVEGPYIGNPCWSGSVWTLTNKAIIDALFCIGEKELATELCLKTLLEFKGNYTEFHHPYNGSGHGVFDYAWTASQFIQIIIENIFGINYDAVNNVITINPNIPKEYKNDTFSIRELSLPNNESIDIFIDENITYNYTGKLKVKITH